MFALITPLANSGRRNHTDKAAAVLSAKQACSGSRYRQSSQVQHRDAARAWL
jgi:hypothetical protein